MVRIIPEEYVGEKVSALRMNDEVVNDNESPMLRAIRKRNLQAMAAELLQDNRHATIGYNLLVRAQSIRL